MANLIPSIFKDNPLMSELSLKHLVYFFIISNATTTGKKIYSEYSYSDVLNKLNYEMDDVKNAIEELAEEGVIIVRREDIQVGSVVGLKSIRKLFTGIEEENKSNNLFSSIESNHKVFMVALEGTSKYYEVENLETKIKKLKNKEFSAWVMADYMDLFSLSYTCMFQEFYREQTPKEFGQMRNLVKVYDTVTLIKMIIYYTCNSESIHKKGLPEIGLLLYHKNTVYSQIAKSKVTEKVRHVKLDDDF